MSLGEKLKVLQGQQAEDARRAALARQAETDENLFVRLLVARQFFDYAYQLFAHRINNGRAPGTVCLGGKDFRSAASKLGTYDWTIPYGSQDWQTKGRGIWSPGNELHDIWREFADRCTSAGLKPHWVAAHDGGGVESWYELTVMPLAA